MDATQEDATPRAVTAEETAGEASRAAMEEAREREMAREETDATEEDAMYRAAMAEETAGEASRAATEEARAAMDGVPWIFRQPL